jgi:hypothetical protein
MMNYLNPQTKHPITGWSKQAAKLYKIKHMRGARSASCASIWFKACASTHTVAYSPIPGVLLSCILGSGEPACKDLSLL